MSKILAIDYGAKRVGIAVTDPLKIIAQPLCTIPPGLVIGWILVYMTQHAVERIVVGLPTQDDGSPSDAQRYIRPFLGRLRKQLPDMEICTIDESYSSVEAHEAMAQGGVPRAKMAEKMGVVDRTAAAIILSRYLETPTLATEIAKK